MDKRGHSSQVSYIATEKWFELALMVLLYMRAGILVVGRSAFAGVI